MQERLLVCKWCNKEFKVTRRGTIHYCSDECRVEARRERDREYKKRIAPIEKVKHGNIVKALVPDWINLKDQWEQWLYIEMDIDDMPEEEKRKLINIYRKKGLKEFREAKKKNTWVTQSSIMGTQIHFR
jgi:hypothetical protein